MASMVWLWVTIRRIIINHFIQQGVKMKVKEYRKWRPTYSQYDKTFELQPWTNHEESSIIGLSAEAGELLGIVQKAKRKGIDIDRDKVIDELGDVFWYLNYVLDAFDISYDEL